MTGMSELVEAIAALDVAMKQPIVVGVYEDSLDVTDEHIVQACRKVQNALANIGGEIDKLTKRMIVDVGGRVIQ
jgi:hypothetical protein